jgi:hypothetical protein
LPEAANLPHSVPERRRDEAVKDFIFEERNIMTKPSFEWVTKGFVPAVAGWRILYHNEEKPVLPMVFPLAGWLIQEQNAYDSRNGANVPQVERADVRIVAGTVDRDEVVEAGDASNFWRVLAPGEDVPDETKCGAACAEYLQKQEKDRQKREKAGL